MSKQGREGRGTRPFSGPSTTHCCFGAVEACLAPAWPAWDLLGTMWHLMAAMLWQVKLFMDGALTYSLCKAWGGDKVTCKGQNRWEPDHQGTRSGCFWFVQIHLQLPPSTAYPPQAGADGRGEKALPLSRALATLQ